MELEKTVASNLTELRKRKQWTQLELADKINYSDKTVSKWERGDGLPDLKTICKLAELFGVTVDYFVTENASSEIKKYSAPKEEKGYHLVISMLAVVGIWLAVTLIYVYTLIYQNQNCWTLFVWGVTASSAVLIYFNIKWGNRKYNLIYSSVLCWSMLASLYLQFLSYNLWAIFIVGVPIQAALVLLALVRLKYR